VSSDQRQYPPPETDHARVQAAKANLRALFRLHARLVRTRNRDLFDLGLSSAGLRIVEVILEHPDANLSVIARVLDLSRQAVHRVVRGLVRLGFLSLRRDPRDGRARIPSITDLGDIYIRDAVACQERAGRDLIAMTRLIDLQFATMLARRLWQRV
jgi:DNA-binding MarR family transcriptional regulator